MTSVYIETTVVGYIAGRFHRDVVVLVRQTISRERWHSASDRYRLLASYFVVAEYAAGDADASCERGHFVDMALIFTSLIPTIRDPYVRPFADPNVKLAWVLVILLTIISRATSPVDAMVDALHIACAAVHRLDYLLPWNCTHIANPMIVRRVFRLLDDIGLPFPVICTLQDIQTHMAMKNPIDLNIEENHARRRAIAKRSGYNAYQISKDAIHRRPVNGGR